MVRPTSGRATDREPGERRRRDPSAEGTAELAGQGLVKPTAATLDRVDRSAFFALLREGEVMPCFYDQFLQVFDPISAA